MTLKLLLPVIQPFVKDDFLSHINLKLSEKPPKTSENAFDKSELGYHNIYQLFIGVPLAFSSVNDGISKYGISKYWIFVWNIALV